MITELTNFVNDLPRDVFSYNLKLDDGLYLEIDIDATGMPVLINQQAYGIKINEETKEKKSGPRKRESNKKIELSDFLEKCLRLQAVTKEGFGEPNRSFNSKDKIFIKTASPFALGFSKKSIKSKSAEKGKIESALSAYFKRAEDFIDNNNAQHLSWFATFRDFCTTKLFDWLNKNELYINAPDKTEVRIIFARPGFEDFQETYERYIAENALDRKWKFPTTLSRFPDQKVFVAHKSAPFTINYQVQPDVAKTIWQFFQLQKRTFPNPLPVFIDKGELNGKVIAIAREDRKIGYFEILKRIFDETTEKDLPGYYLLFFVRNEIADVDFVPSFKYHLENMYIHQVFDLGGEKMLKIANVWEFEREVANKIFDNQLVVESQNGIWVKYFDKIEYDPKYITHNTFNLLLKYRHAFYNYIYKSNRSAIQDHVFHEIMRSSILDLIHRDGGKNSQNNYDYNIKEKLNIWFSLFDYFIPQHSKATVNMVNKTQILLERMREIAKEGAEEVFQNDEEFAFASGQLIRFLLSKSETESLSHALLEPFLQKTDPGLFKLAIARTFDTYKHAIKLYRGFDRYGFDKLMSVTMGYEPKPGTNMKDYLVLVLAGYFSKSVFYKDAQTNHSETNS